MGHRIAGFRNVTDFFGGAERDRIADLLVAKMRRTNLQQLIQIKKEAYLSEQQSVEIVIGTQIGHELDTDPESREKTQISTR
jgi:hypothetical protein